MARAYVLVALCVLAVACLGVRAQETDAPGLASSAGPEEVITLAVNDKISKQGDNDDDEGKAADEDSRQAPRILTEDQAKQEKEEREKIDDEQEAAEAARDQPDLAKKDEDSPVKDETPKKVSTAVRPTPEPHLPKTKAEEAEEAAEARDQAIQQKLAPELNEKKAPAPTPAPKKKDDTFDPNANAPTQKPTDTDKFAPEEDDTTAANNAGKTDSSATPSTTATSTSQTTESTTETPQSTSGSSVSNDNDKKEEEDKPKIVKEAPLARGHGVPADCEFCVRFVLNNVPRAAHNYSHLLQPCPDHKGLLYDACSHFASQERIPLAVALDPEIVCPSIEMCKKEDAKKMMAHITKLPQGRKLRSAGTVEITAEAYNMGYLNKGTGERTVIQRIAFDSVPFEYPPMVHVALSSLDVDDEAATRINVEARNVGVYGMDIVVTTWGDSKVRRLSVDWFAYSTIYAADSALRTGRVSVKKPPRTYLKRIFFPSRFTNAPEVTVAIAGLHVLYGGANDVSVKVQSVNEGSMEILMTAGPGTTVEWIRYAWTAYEPARAAMWSDKIILTPKVKGFEVMSHHEQPKRKYEQKVRFDKRVQQYCPPFGAAQAIVKPATESTVAMKGCHIRTVTAPAFKTAPWVRTELSSIQFSRDSPVEVTTQAVDISEEGFTLVIHAGPDVVLEALDVTFIALEQPIGWKPTLPQSEQKQKELTPEALNSPDNPGRSCHDIMVKQASRGNGIYWVRVFGGEKVQVFCDMTGGGWTRVVNIHGDSYYHADNGTAVNMDHMFDPKVAAKLSDQMINTMNYAGYWKIRCGSYTGYVRNDKNKWTSKLDNDYFWQTTRSEDLGLKWECDATANGYVFSDENASGHGECEQEDNVSYAAPTLQEGLGCKHGGADAGWDQDGSLWVK